MKKLIAPLIFCVLGASHFAYAGAVELWLMKNNSNTDFYVDVVGDSDGTCNRNYSVLNDEVTYSGGIENDSWWACKLAPNEPFYRTYTGTISTRDRNTKDQVESIRYQSSFKKINNSVGWNGIINYTSAKGVSKSLTCAGYFAYDYSTWINIIINADKTISLTCS
jgi:hypothetical protein